MASKQTAEQASKQTSSSSSLLVLKAQTLLLPQLERRREREGIRAEGSESPPEIDQEQREEGGTFCFGE